MLLPYTLKLMRLTHTQEPDTGTGTYMSTPPPPPPHTKTEKTAKPNGRSTVSVVKQGSHSVATDRTVS